MFPKKKSPITAIIPARKGSKGIPNKNVLKLGKYDLLERTILLAKSCNYIDQILVSTDSPEILQTAHRHGLKTLGLRPADLATDTASTIDVISHSLEEAKIQETNVLLLQVTTPLRTVSDLNSFLEAFDNDPEALSSVSITPLDSPHPDKVQIINKGYVESYLGKNPSIARQLLPEVYSLNGAFYLASSNHLKTHRNFFSDRTKPFVLPKERSFNLDHRWDWILLETLIKSGEINFEEY